MDLEHKAIERLKLASGMSLLLYKQPLVITYSGGKDSDTLLHLAEISGINIHLDICSYISIALLTNRTKCFGYTDW